MNKQVTHISHSIIIIKMRFNKTATRLLQKLFIANALSLNPFVVVSGKPADEMTVNFVGTAQLPLPVTDAALGMYFNVGYREDFSGMCPLSQAQQFFADTTTVAIDYSLGVFYTKWGTSIRNEDQFAQAQTCFSDPYLWDYELPAAADTMKIYEADIGDGNKGATRVDFFDSQSGTYGYQDVCMPGTTYSVDVPISANTATDPVIFYMVQADTMPDNQDMSIGLFAVQHGSTNLSYPTGLKYDDHPFHHALFKIELFFDPAIVKIVGSQSDNDREILSRAQFFGIYYQVVPTMPICDIAVHSSSLSLTVLAGTGSAQTHSFSLDASASCHELRPATIEVTHDYAYPTDLTAVASETTPGSYVDFDILVTPLATLYGPITFTFKFGIDVKNSQPLQNVDVLQLTHSCPSLTFTSSIGTIPLADNAVAHTITFPTFALAKNIPCWSFSIAETTTGPTTMASQDNSILLTLDDLISSTVIQVPAMTQNVVAEGLYEFTITATESFDSTTVLQVFIFEVYRTDPCWTTGLILIAPFADSEHSTWDPQLNLSWSGDADFGDVAITPISCGPFNIELWLLDGTTLLPIQDVTTLPQPSFTLDTLTRTFSALATSDVTDAGVYLIASKISLVDYPTALGGPDEDFSPPFTLTVIDSCAIPTVDPLTIETQEYTLFDELQVMSLPKFTINPPDCACTYTFTSFDLITSESIMELEQGANDLSLSFYSDDFSVTTVEAPDYFLDYPVTIRMVSGSVISTTIFNMRIHNPCADPTKVTIEGAMIGQQLEYLIGSEPVILQVDTSLYSTLDACGDVSVLLRSDSDAYTFDESTDEISIFTEAVAKNLKTDSIIVQPFLTNYIWIMGAESRFTVTFSVEEVSSEFQTKVNCSSEVRASFIKDIEFILGSEPLTIKLDYFDGGAAENNCGAIWSYELIVIDQSESGADTSDYFNFDAQKLLMTLKAGAELPQNTISLLLLGNLSSKDDSSDVKRQQKSTSFKLVFAEEAMQSLGPIPRPFIKSISTRGLLLVHFDVDMAIPDRITTSVEAAVGDSDLEARNLATNKGMVTGSIKTTDIYDKALQSAFDVVLLPNDSEFTEKMKFGFELKHFEPRELAVQLRFENPSFISQSTEADLIVVRLKDPEHFRSKKGQPVEADFETQYKIGPQIGEDASSNLETFGQATALVITVNSIVSVMMNFAMNQSMTSMVQLVKQLQIIVHLLLLQIILPANTVILFSQLVGILTFDPIDITDQIGDIFDLSTDLEVDDPNFVNLEYASPFTLINFGSLTLFVAIEFALMLIFALLSTCSCCKKCQQYGRRKLKDQFWNSFLVFFDGSLLVLLISPLLNVKEVQIGKVEVNISFWVSLVVLVLCAAYLVFQIIFFWKCRHRLEDPKIKEKFGALYQHYNLKEKHMNRVWQPIVSTGRLVLFCLIVVVMDFGLVIQVLFLQLATILVIVQLGNRPYRDHRITNIEYVAEYTILGVSTFVMTSSDPALDPDSRQNLGFMINTYVIFFIILTQFNLMRDNFRSITIWCRRRKYRKAVKKMKNKKTGKLQMQMHRGLSQSQANLVSDNNIGKINPLSQDKAGLELPSTKKRKQKKMITIEEEKKEARRHSKSNIILTTEKDSKVATKSLHDFIKDSKADLEQKQRILGYQLSGLVAPRETQSPSELLTHPQIFLRRCINCDTVLFGKTCVFCEVSDVMKKDQGHAEILSSILATKSLAKNDHKSATVLHSDHSRDTQEDARGHPCHQVPSFMLGTTETNQLLQPRKSTLGKISSASGDQSKKNRVGEIPESQIKNVQVQPRITLAPQAAIAQSEPKWQESMLKYAQDTDDLIKTLDIYIIPEHKKDMARRAEQRITKDTLTDLKFI